MMTQSQSGNLGGEAENAFPPIFGLADIYKVIKRRLRLILGITILGVLLSIVFALSLGKLYTSKVTLLVDSRQNNVVDFEGVLSGLGTDSSAIESEVELLKSRAVARRVVDKLKLHKDPEFVGGTSFTGSIKSSLMNLVKAEEAIEKSEEEIKNSVVDAVMKRFAASRKGLTYVIEARFTSNSPQRAAKIANAFAEEYLIDQLEAKFDATKRANDWLNDRVSELRARVSAAEKAVQDYKAANNLADSEGVTLGDQQISQLNEQLILARAKTAEAKARVDQIERVLKAGQSPASFADSLQSNVIADLRSKYAEIAREEAELSSKYGRRHPSVINVRAQLADINRQIRDEIGRIVAGSRNEYEVALSRAQSIEESLEELKAVQAVSNADAVELRQLESEAETTRRLFESFLSRFKETQQQASLQTADTRIIAKALPPRDPSYPKRKLIVLLAAFMSLGLGVVLAFIMEFLDSTVRTREQLEDTIGVNQLASVPRLNSGIGDTRNRNALTHKLKRLLKKIFSRTPSFTNSAGRDITSSVSMSSVVVDKPLSKYTEAIRALRMGIKFATIDDPAKIVMFTSAVPSEGKSTVAINLARYAASTGEKALLIDADLRHPVLTQVLDASGQGQTKTGLVDVLTERATLEEAVIKDKKSGLSFISGVGSHPVGHTSEILASDKMKALLKHAKQSFDLVIVDSAPLLPVVDSRALLSAVDASVMVVAWGRTERAAVRSALAETPGFKESLIGAVLNDVDLESMQNYEYYKSSAYLKAYPYYYSDH